MQIVKTSILFVIFVLSNLIGRVIAGKYRYRLEELQDMKSALSIFKTKVKFTFEPIPEIFSQIAESLNSSISKIFESANDNMKNVSAGQAWEEAIFSSQNYLCNEDKKVLQMMSKMLGEADAQGQISQIEVTEEFLDRQIQEAEKEKYKNEKLYRKLGTIMGVAIIIILI